MNKQCSGWTLNNFKRETYKVGPEKTWTPTLILKLTWNWISVTNCGLKNCEVNLANSSIVQVHCNICPNFKFTIFLHQSFHPKSALLGIWLYIMMDTWQAQDISSRSNIHPPPSFKCLRLKTGALTLQPNELHHCSAAEASFRTIAPIQRMIND